MENKYKVIDEEDWKRAMHCKIFRNNVEPSYCITFELEITNFIEKIKEKGDSFTMSLVFLSSKCANSIEEFKYRFLEGKIVLYEKINTSFTYLDKTTELFKVVNVEMRDTLEEYIQSAIEKVKSQKEYFTGPLANDTFQFSPLPWITYTHISHTNSGKKDNATPIFNWGKYFERGGKFILPYSVQVHHSFVDGIHIARFVEILQKELNDFN